MTRDELRAELLKYEDAAMNIYAHANEHVPMVLLIGPDKSILPFGFDINLDRRSPEAEESRRIIQSVCAIGALSGAEAVVFICEAWTVHSPPGVNPQQWKREFDEWRKTHPSFEEHPDRIEILAMQGACRDGIIMQPFRIKRPGDHGAKASLIPMDAQYDRVESRFLDGLVWGPSERWAMLLQAIQERGRQL